MTAVLAIIIKPLRSTLKTMSTTRFILSRNLTSRKLYNKQETVVFQKFLASRKNDSEICFFQYYLCLNK